jgi:lipopolysaccharide export system permease protein
MIGMTLALYFAGRFAKMVGAMFLLSLGLICAVSFVDLFGRTAQVDGFSATRLALAVILRTPSVAEETLPFAVLFGSIAAFVTANRRLEVVVARAAGVSAWQFLVPACLVGLAYGLVATTLYNPLAADLLSLSSVFRATVNANATADAGGPSGPIWLRQTTGDGRESIIGAAESKDQGTTLVGVTTYVFNQDGKFTDRIDSATARYESGEWSLLDATLTAANKKPVRIPVYKLPTTLTPDEVRQTFENVDTVPFWSLPTLIAAAHKAGLPGDAYKLRFNWLLARPILLLAMVLIAATVSLRFSRSQDLSRMILAGVGIGFMLYVVTKIARDLGSGGIVPPMVAAWLPAFVAILIGATVLLHLEDG